MENNLQNNAVKSSEHTKEPERLLCDNCFEFYGNPANNNLCSKCFKDLQGREDYPKKHKAPTSSPILEHRTARLEQLIKELKELNEIDEAALEADKKKEEEKKEAEKPKQTDTSRCWKCPKKTGLLGHTCKCGFVFCKSHRLPEDHDCNFDFVTVEKEKLKKANPVVVGSKLEKF